MNNARLDALDPLTRAEFDAKPIRRWRITWPDGTSEVIQGHMVQPHGEGAVGFYWSYLGLHRIVSLAHVRDIAELFDEDEQP